MTEYPHHTSASQVNMGSACMRKYWYKYIEKVPEPTTSIKLITGTVCHKALQHWYECLRDGITLPDAPTLKAYAQDWLTAEVFKVTQKQEKIIEYPYKNKSESNERETAADALKFIAMAIDAFLDNPYRPAEVIAIEHEFRLNVAMYNREIVGYIDLIAVDRSGAHMIVDHKTGGQATSTEKLFDAKGLTFDSGKIARPDFQMSLYEGAVKALLNEPNVVLAHQKITVTKTKANCRLIPFATPPGYMAQCLEDIHSNFRRLDLLTKQHEPKILFNRSRSQMNCSICSFEKICNDDYQRKGNSDD